MAPLKSPLEKANGMLAGTGCRWRIRVNSKSPFYYVRVTRGPDRLQERSARNFLTDEPGDLDRLTNALLGWEKIAAKKDSTLCLATLPLEPAKGGARNSQTWGWIKDFYAPLLEPGGKLGKQRGTFGYLKAGGYFDQRFSDDTVARPEHLEQFALYTTESLLANYRNPSAPLQDREYGRSGFRGAKQVIYDMNKRGIRAATPELKDKLKLLASDAGVAPAAPRFMPADDEAVAWIDELMQLDPYRGTLFAFVYTFGLRPHEVWHIAAFPGEVNVENVFNPNAIEVGTFEGGDEETKTGFRFAIACPPELIERWQLNDLEAIKQWHAELLSRVKIRTVELPDGRTVYANNAHLGSTVAHWLNDKTAPHKEVPVKLYGQIDFTMKRGQTKRASKKGRVQAYTLRHMWALRAKRLTTWTTEAKAEAMGHSESVHSKRYLVEERKADKLRALTESTRSAAVASPPIEPVSDPSAEDDGITKLRKAKALLDQGLITQEKFDQLQDKVLGL